MGFETPTPPEVEAQKPVIDMAPILERVPPIEGVFSPSEEVQKLWTVPREQRREAVSVFKDKLARQREAWALCRTNIEERIEANPDLPREEMVRIIREFSSHYGFADSHVKVAESLIDDYMEMHRRVNEVREQCPDNIVLINHLTGMKFTQADAEDFEITFGPMAVEISCPGFNAGRIYEKSKDPVVGFKYGGFASTSGGGTPTYYIVVNNDAVHDHYREEIVPHEREHQKNRLLNPKLYGISDVRDDVREQLNRGVLGFLRHQVGEKVLGLERNFEGEVFQKYESEKDPQKKAFLLAEYMRLKRESGFNRAKDEIIAYFAGGRQITGFDVYFYFLSQDGGPYDYLKKIRDRDKKKDDPMWQETAQSVLVDEYSHIIITAVDAFNQLVRSGYSKSVVIAMLTDKRLAEWPKTAKRLLEQKIK